MKTLLRTSYQEDPQGWRQEGRDLMAAIAGGSIVGMPLIYTMEMWFRGMTLSPWHVLSVIGAILVVNFFFCLISGFRDDKGVDSALSDSITSVGIALLFSSLMLWLVGAISAARSWGELLGKVVLEAAAVSLGVAFANVHFRGKSRTGENENGNGGDPTTPPDETDDPERAQLIEDVRDIGATIAGSVLFALNIAPTEEIVLVATRLGPWAQLLLLAASLMLCYVILFASGFEDQPVYVKSLVQSPWAETFLTTGVALLTALVLLWLLGERTAFSSPANLVGCVVALGVPATVGGAAGRLVV